MSVIADKMPKIASLMMEPEDWKELHDACTSDMYALMVNEYQRREAAVRPKCPTIFGLCRYYDHGKCGAKKKCG